MIYAFLMGILTVYLVRLCLTSGKYCPTSVYRTCPSNTDLTVVLSACNKIGHSWQSRARP